MPQKTNWKDKLWKILRRFYVAFAALLHHFESALEDLFMRF